VRLSPLGTSSIIWPIVPAPDDRWWWVWRAVDEMRIGKGNRSTRRKSASVPLCPPQIPHDLTWDWTRAAAVGNRRLTAWAMARPSVEGLVSLGSAVRIWDLQSGLQILLYTIELILTTFWCQ
jgi:hypothetical protein